MMDFVDRERAEFGKFLAEELQFSRASVPDFQIYNDLLFKWQKAKNLVSRETLNEFWSRHVADSAMVCKYASLNGVWLDLGSGAGFPGLVIAILKKSEGSDGAVFLVESNGRKAAFLRVVIRELGLNATVLNERIESVSKQSLDKVDFVSARALASLSDLLGFAQQHCEDGAVCYFHKGREIDGEILAASNNWDFDLVKYQHPRPMDHPDDGVIVEVKNIRKKSPYHRQ